SQQEKGEKLNPFVKRHSSLRQREIGIGAQILHDLGIRKIRLLTNNPRPRPDVGGYDLEIVEQVAI
ncbi:MAG TPA: bifunctional 3,4-dihydroxy-2-butanone-4-phosphate synthase/GTP cyclohydrolase II, partial [Saprospiraceae bacterium]|nr:bifunctional 3,4-dihydroxy-2-butanone-4-phosphate synthase/GTP cyclohydrolase II [Saprospiraceae bacterium]